MSSLALVPLLVSLVVVRARAALDCRAACHACRARAQPGQLLDIYCAMCHECKERRKDLLRTKVEMARQRGAETTTQLVNINKLENTDKESMNVNDNFSDGQPPLTESNKSSDQSPNEAQNEFAEPIGTSLRESNVQHSMTAHDHNLATNQVGPVIVEIPEGCPTPEPCSDDEGIIVKIMPTTTMTPAPTTTTTPVTCPVIRPCKKRTTTPPPPSSQSPCCMIYPVYPYYPPPGYPYSPPPGYPNSPPPGYPYSPPPAYPYSPPPGYPNSPPPGYPNSPPPGYPYNPPPAYPYSPPPGYPYSPPPGYPYSPAPGIPSYPAPGYPSHNAPLSAAAFKINTDNEYAYVYIGLPKNAIRKSGVKKSNVTYSDQ